MIDSFNSLLSNPFILGPIAAVALISILVQAANSNGPR